MEEHSLHHVGPRRSGIVESCVEYVLHQYRSTYTFNCFVIQLILVLMLIYYIFFPLVCNTGSRFDRQRTIKCYSTGAAQNPGSRRAAPVSRSGPGQQTGRQRIDDSCGNIPPPQSDVNQET